MAAPLRITSPVSSETVAKLKAGTEVLVSGVLYTARDAAHRRIVEALDKGTSLPLDLRGQTVYYMGPAPAKPGQVSGAAGPTTSGRMDVFTPRLLAAGMRAMIGKGPRSPEVRQAIKQHGAVYLVAVGGIGALLARTIKKIEVIAYEDLGAEAVMRLTVADFPAIVADDSFGGDLFELGRARYQKEG